MEAIYKKDYKIESSKTYDVDKFWGLVELYTNKFEEGTLVVTIHTGDFKEVVTTKLLKTDDLLWFNAEGSTSDFYLGGIYKIEFDGVEKEEVKEKEEGKGLAGFLRGAMQIMGGE